LEFAALFDNFHLGPEGYDAALEILARLQIFPRQDSNSEIFYSGERLQQLDPGVRVVIGSVAVAAMEMYSAKYTALRSHLQNRFRALVNGTSDNEERSRMMQEYRERARALVNLFGMFPRIVGPDIHSKLVKLEALI
jgi:hypothetical protein